MADRISFNPEWLVGVEFRTIVTVTLHQSDQQLERRSSRRSIPATTTGQTQACVKTSTENTVEPWDMQTGSGTQEELRSDLRSVSLLCLLFSDLLTLWVGKTIHTSV